MKLSITLGKVKLQVDLLQTETGKALIAALPFESRAQTWGEEVYFSTPVSASLEPCARPKLASPCNVVGKLADFHKLAAVKAGDRVRVEAA